MNLMTVTKVFTLAEGFPVDLDQAKIVDVDLHPGLRRLMQVGNLCNNAFLDEHSKWIGQPTDIALIEVLKGLNITDERPVRPLLDVSALRFCDIGLFILFVTLTRSHVFFIYFSCLSALQSSLSTRIKSSCMSDAHPFQEANSAISRRRNMLSIQPMRQSARADHLGHFISRGPLSLSWSDVPTITEAKVIICPWMSKQRTRCSLRRTRWPLTDCVCWPWRLAMILSV